MDGVFAACVAAAGGPVPPGLKRVDPKELLSGLDRHKMVAHSECLAEHLSAEQIAVLRPEWTARAARCLAHLGELQRLLPALKAAGLPAFTMKGVVLQQALHGRAVGRDHVDLDLVVAPGHFLAVARWLLVNGYSLTGLPESVLMGPLPSALPFHRPDGIGLDLHRRVFASFYALDQAEAALMAHREGDSFDQLGTDLLVLLTGGKDVWSTIRHLADITVVHGRTDRRALAALADRTRTRGIVDAGMGLAERVLGLSNPWPRRTSCGLDERVAALHAPRNDHRGWDRTMGYLRARERWRSRVEFLVRVPVATTYGDLRHGGLDRKGRVATRLWRLMGKYLRHPASDDASAG